MNKLLAMRRSNLSLNKEQAASVVAPKSNIVVSAAAGSGKTFTMTERILQRLLSGELSLERVLILTFTEAASKNMQASLQKKIIDCQQSLAALKSYEHEDSSALQAETALLEQALADLHNAQISTLHAFCKQLIAQLANNLPSPLAEDLLYVKNAKIAESQITDNLLDEAISQVLYKLFAADNLRTVYELIFAEPFVSENADLQTLLQADLPLKQPEGQTFFKQLTRIEADLPKLLQSLLTQADSKKNLQAFQELLRSKYLQMRTYEDYQIKLYQAANAAERWAEKPETSPAYFYCLEELAEAYALYKEEAAYLQAELAHLTLVSGLTEKKLQDPKYLKSKQYEMALANQKRVKAHLQALFAALDNLAPCFTDFAKLKAERQAAAAKRLHLGVSGDAPLTEAPFAASVFANLYAQLQKLGAAFPLTPEVDGVKGDSKRFVFNRAYKSEDEKAYYTLFTKTVAPLLTTLAPQAQVVSSSDKTLAPYLLCQTAVVNLTEDFVRRLQQEQADKILLLSFILLAVDKAYTKLKRSSQVIDFSDLEQHAYRLLQNPQAQAYCLQKYLEIYVDEYQDTSSIQEAILRCISADNLFVVGDLKQSIYRFRNAKLENFANKLQLAKITAAANSASKPGTNAPIAKENVAPVEQALAVKASETEQFTLADAPSTSYKSEQTELAQTQWHLFNFNRNYRSDAAVLAFVNQIFSQMFLEPLVDFDYLYDEHSLLWREIDTYKQTATALTNLRVQINDFAQAFSNSAAVVESQNYLATHLAYEQKSLVNATQLKKVEAHVCAWQIKQLIDSGVAPSEIAVLAKRHKELTEVKAALAQLYISASGKEQELNNPIASLPQVELFAFLQVLDNPLQDEPLLTFLTSAYAPQTLTLEELAEIKASFNDHVQAKLAAIETASASLKSAPATADKESPDKAAATPLKTVSDLEVENYTANLRNLSYLPLYKLLGFYHSADLRAELAAEFTGFNERVQVELAEKLALNLQALASYRQSLQVLPFKEAWQLLFQKVLGLRRLPQSGLAFRSALSKLTAANAVAGIKDLLILFPEAKQLPLETAENLSSESVNLLTFHASKGLEFDYVFLLGLDAKVSVSVSNLAYLPELGFVLADSLDEVNLLYPSLHKAAAEIINRKQTYAEELRLLYVALTRAKKTLYLNLDLQQLAKKDLSFDPQVKISQSALAKREQNCLRLYPQKTYAELITYALQKTALLPKNLAWMLAADYQDMPISCWSSLAVKSESHAYWQINHLQRHFIAQVLAESYLTGLQLAEFRQLLEAEAAQELAEEIAAEQDNSETATTKKVAKQAVAASESAAAEGANLLKTPGNDDNSLNSELSATERLQLAKTLSEEKLMLYTAPETVSAYNLAAAESLALADFLQRTATATKSLAENTQVQALLQNLQRAAGVSIASLAADLADLALPPKNATLSFEEAVLAARARALSTNEAALSNKELALQQDSDIARLKAEFVKFFTEQLALEFAKQQADFAAKYSVSQLKKWYQRTQSVEETAGLLSNYSMERELPSLDSLLTDYVPLDSTEPAANALNAKATDETMLRQELNKLTAAEKGTLLHKYMQFIKLSTLQTIVAEYQQRHIAKEAAQTAIIDILRRELVTEVATAFYPAYMPLLLANYWQQIAAFFTDELSYKMCRSAAYAAQGDSAEYMFYREMAFTISCSYAELESLYPGGLEAEADLDLASKAGDYLQIQGVIDLWFVHEGQLYVIDYKSDHVPANVEDLRTFFAQRYALQLQVYTMAVAKGLNIPETEFKQRCHAYIYSLELGAFVELPLQSYYLTIKSDD